MAETIRTYSPQEVNVSWAGLVPITNFAEGSSIEASRNSANSTQLVGMQGDVGLTYNADKTGTLTFTIMQTGETNRYLSAVQNIQDTTGKIIREDITISDPSGSFLCLASNCHISEPPTVTLGDDQASKVWTFYVERLDFVDVPVGFVGSATSVANVESAVGALSSASAALEELLG